jgi:hypothetical protein|tara:strand:+ start:10236 stop:10619 length:384 start_codon:yes stop_codon:yes gene_type:complete
MISKEAYTKVFLKQANISLGENTMKEYMPIWWKNTRRSGGLRLTDEGFTFITERLEIQVYEVPFPVDFTLTTQVIIFLDKYINCPYLLAEDGIVVTNERKAMELMLFSGDIRKYGLNKAISRLETEE